MIRRRPVAVYRVIDEEELLGGEPLPIDAPEGPPGDWPPPGEPLPPVAVRGAPWRRIAPACMLVAGVAAFVLVHGSGRGRVVAPPAKAPPIARATALPQPATRARRKRTPPVARVRRRGAPRARSRPPRRASRPPRRASNPARRVVRAHRRAVAHRSRRKARGRAARRPRRGATVLTRAPATVAAPAAPAPQVEAPPPPLPPPTPATEFGFER